MNLVDVFLEEHRLPGRCCQVPNWYTQAVWVTAGQFFEFTAGQLGDHTAGACNMQHVVKAVEVTSDCTWDTRYLYDFVGTCGTSVGSTVLVC